MTLGIIALNVLVFLAFNIANIIGPDSVNFAAVAFGHVPSVANDVKTLPIQYRIVPHGLYGLTALSSAFLHADLWHLGGNMLFLWVFGDNVEDAMGHFKFLVFYVACAFAAAWFHAFAFPNSDAPLIGASGAAAGIVAAYLMLHPKMKVWVLFLARFPLKLPALWLLGGWIAYQVFMFVTATGSQVSWAAHVGGIAAGIALVGFLKRRDVPLFDRFIVAPEAVVLEPQADLPSQSKPSRWGRGANQ